MKRLTRYYVSQILVISFSFFVSFILPSPLLLILTLFYSYTVVSIPYWWDGKPELLLDRVSFQTLLIFSYYFIILHCIVQIYIKLDPKFSFHTREQSDMIAKWKVFPFLFRSFSNSFVFFHLTNRVFFLLYI